jgi:Lipoprotein LpqB beta-propeller domain/Sporulation and spore germination
MRAGGSARRLPRRGRPGAGARARRRWLPVAASLLAALVSACATLPGNSSVQDVRPASEPGGAGQANLQMIPLPPQPDWTSSEVVNGFLAALVSFDGNPQAVRRYLVGASSTWNPSPGVVILNQAPLVRETKSPNGSVGEQNALVTASSTQMAGLTANGQYLTEKPYQQVSYTFDLVNLGPGVGWRINAPTIPLLVTQQDFGSLYTPRNLYFLANSGQSLVPDPVFVPVRATSVDLANQLVSALLSGPAGWLSGTVTTAFPVSTEPPDVTIEAGTATVNLTGPAAALGETGRQQLLGQVFWTLTSPSYAPPIVQRVQLDVNGVVKASAGVGSSLRYTVPEPSPGSPLYVIGAHGAIDRGVASPDGSVSLSAAPVATGASGPFSRIAISPDGKYIAAITQSHNAVYYGPLGGGAKLTRWSEGGGYTSVSWDEQDNLWVAAPPTQVWLLPARGGADTVNNVTAVNLQTLQQSGESLSQFQIAPDGVRYAIIVNQPGGGSPKLQVGAIAYTNGGAVASQPQVTITAAGIADPTDVSWYDADNLTVLSGSPADPQVWEESVDNESWSSIATEPGAESVSAAGPGNPIIEGLAGGKLALIGGGEHTIDTNVGLDPTYPG